MFKKGDKVKLKTESRYFDQSKGDYGTIVSISNSTSWAQVAWAYGFTDNYPFEDLIGVSNVDEPIKYVVSYLRDNIDPVEYFTTETEVKKWLHKAHENRRIQFSSIRIFQVSAELKLKTEFRLLGLSKKVTLQAPKKKLGRPRKTK